MERHLREHEPRYLEELKAFLRIPSVSALPEHRPDLERAAAWLAERLRAAGVPEVEVWPTGGAPAVYGRWPAAAPERPTVLVYGHYDVQPPDPLDRWETPPFEPAVRDGCLFARGASDDKGNLLIPVLAAEALGRVEGGPPLHLVFLFEGEEEVGSPHLAELLRRERGRLRADLVLAADGDMWDADTPSLTVGCRGIAALELRVRGPRSDLHSGIHGGAVQNPIHALVALLAGMRAPDGRVTVAGFYDGVRPLTEEERRRIAEVPFDEEAYRAELGVPALWGEAGFGPLERAWVRPTLEVNGIAGGFQGEGIKTVLPAEARAKLTCRLVPDQDPEQVLDAIEEHVRQHAPPGVEVEVHRFPGSARAYRLPPDHPALAAAARVLAEVYGRPPLYVMTGGTLPVARLVRDELAAWLVFFSFGERDNRIHGPNEFLRLRSFRRGTLAYARLFRELAGMSPAALRGA